LRATSGSSGELAQSHGFPLTRAFWVSLSATGSIFALRRVSNSPFHREQSRGAIMATTDSTSVDRQTLVELLNEDLSREYQAIIGYVNYSQVLKGAQYMNIAGELEKHAAEELAHALKIAHQIDYLGGMPTVTPALVKTSEKAEDMLRFDLENERQTIINYRTRIRQADSIGEFALSEVLREIIVQEQDHLIDLATALGIDPPDVSDGE
jgi:bacterioferritin